MPGVGPEKGGRTGTVRNAALFCEALRTNGEPCTKYALRGSTRCRHHTNPAVIAARDLDRELAGHLAYFAQLAPATVERLLSEG